jgi:hypothetical protein
LQAREQAVQDAGCDGEYGEDDDDEQQLITRPRVHDAARTALEDCQRLSDEVGATRAPRPRAAGAGRRGLSKQAPPLAQWFWL